MTSKRACYRRRFLRFALISLGAVCLLSIIVSLLYFPWHVDPTNNAVSSTRPFYNQAYDAVERRKRSEAAVSPSPREQSYIGFARSMSLKYRVPERVKEFVDRFSLNDKKVLEVGAGSGMLQDIVRDYTGLDISASARRFFHKPFVEASATEIPFPDSTFDAIWSIWVLEHIPMPEKALTEMRRVTKPGGYLFLEPSFNVSKYAAQGYRVRPYSDFDWTGKLIKAAIPIQESRILHYLHYHQIRMLRSIFARLTGGPSRLHFIRLIPNYENYYEPDADATTSLSPHELYLWFSTRGDKCMNCPSESDLVFRDVPVVNLIIQKAPR